MKKKKKKMSSKGKKITAIILAIIGVIDFFTAFTRSSDWISYVIGAVIFGVIAYFVWPKDKDKTKSECNSKGQDEESTPNKLDGHYDMIFKCDVYTWKPDHVQNLRTWLSDNKRKTWYSGIDEEMAEKKSTRRLYEFKFTRTHDVGLRPEPDNEYDPNAILVLLGGKPIGYVPKDDTKTLREKEIGSMQLVIKGGRYKEYEPEYDMVKTYEYEFSPVLEVGLKA